MKENNRYDMFEVANDTDEETLLNCNNNSDDYCKGWQDACILIYKQISELRKSSYEMSCSAFQSIVNAVYYKGVKQ